MLERSMSRGRDVYGGPFALTVVMKDIGPAFRRTVNAFLCVLMVLEIVQLHPALIREDCQLCV